MLSYWGQTVALAARARFWLAALPAGHPDKRHVAFMALYARDFLTGDMPRRPTTTPTASRAFALHPARVTATPREPGLQAPSCVAPTGVYRESVRRTGIAAGGRRDAVFNAGGLDRSLRG